MPRCGDAVWACVRCARVRRRLHSALGCRLPAVSVTLDARPCSTHGRRPLDEELGLTGALACGRRRALRGRWRPASSHTPGRAVRARLRRVRRVRLWRTFSRAIEVSSLPPFVWASSARWLVGDRGLAHDPFPPVGQNGRIDAQYVRRRTVQFVSDGTLVHPRPRLEVLRPKTPIR